MGGLRDQLRKRARTPLPSALIERLALVKVLLDLAAWGVAISLAAWVRLSMAGTRISVAPLVRALAFRMEQTAKPKTHL